MDFHATALRHMMAARGLTLRQVIDATGLHERTVKAVLRGKTKPHARTLHALAVGLGFDAREFFPLPDTSAAVVVPLADKPILEQVAKLLESESRDLLVGVVGIMARQLEPAPEAEPCEATS